jgi:hypothetical protein
MPAASISAYAPPPGLRMSFVTPRSRACTNWSDNPAARRRLLIRDRLGSTHRIMHDAHNLLDEMKTEKGNNPHFSMSFAIFPLHIFV